MNGFASWAVPLAALIIAIGGIIFTIFNIRMKSTKDYIEQLQQQLRQTSEDLEKCREHCENLERERNDLRGDNYELMRRMIGMPVKPT